MQAYLTREAEVAGLAAIDAWVLGKRATPVAYEGEELTILQNKMRALYLQDYKRRWQGAIRSIQLLPAHKLRETVAQLQTLSESGLYRNLLSVIHQNTVFTTEKGGTKASAVDGTAKTAVAGAETEKSDVQKVQATKDRAIQYVTQALQKQFADYNKLLAKKIDDVDATLVALSTYMNDVAEQSVAVDYYALTKVTQKFSAQGADDPMGSLSILAGNLPQPMAPQLTQIANQCWRILLGLAVADLNKAWGTEVYQYYVDNLQGRYPFIKTNREAALESIQAFYGTEGVLDVFYQTYLKPLLDNEGRLNGLNVADIQRVYKHAEYIRDGLFTAAGELKIAFTIEPTNLSRAYLATTLTVDGVTVKYNHGTPLPTDLIWPNPEAAAQETSITFNPLNRNARAEQRSASGEWGLFRLLDQAQTQALGDRVREVSFSASAGVAGYLITVPASVNPLTKDLFSGFQLPPALVGRAAVQDNVLLENELSRITERVY